MTLAQLQSWLPQAVPVFAAGQTQFTNEVQIKAVRTDSRSVVAGDLFVALKGEKFDGTAFLAQAQAQGAVAVVFEESNLARGEHLKYLQAVTLPAFCVTNAREALGELAAQWRRQFALNLIGVTGSNGKTTVTQMIASIALISSDYGTIVGAPNIANLSKLNFVNEIKAEFKLPIVVENDANSAMWAEFKFGNAKGLNPVMFFIIGTGVGGGLVIDGKLFKGANGIGAEFGHMCVVSNGLLCGCGSKGCIEQYASGGALIRYANEVILNNPQSSETLLSFGEGKVTGPGLTKAAKAGNELALAAFNKQADWLGLACASYSSIIDPEAIIIGGGVADAGELFLAPVREAMRKYMPFAESHASPKIIAAKFGNDAGLIGAADLVRV